MKTFDQSPTNPAFVQDPYPFYERLRSAGDFVHWRDYGIPMAVTDRAVNAVLRHPKLGRALPEPLDVPEHLKAFYEVEAYSLLELEAPDHTRLRKLVLGAFTRASVMQLAPEITRIANALIERGIGKSDVVATYMYNSIDHACVWLACIKLGAVFASLNVSLAPAELEAVEAGLVVLAAGAEADAGTTHGHDRDVSREGDEVRPGDGVAVLELDRLQNGQRLPSSFWDTGESERDREEGKVRGRFVGH